MLAKLVDNAHMADVRQIRRDNLRTLIAEAGSQAVVAEKAKCSAAYISQIMSDSPSLARYKLGDDVARKMEAAFGKPYGWMDAPHTEADPRDDEERDFIELAMTVYRHFPHLTRQSMKDILARVLAEEAEKKKPKQ